MANKEKTEVAERCAHRNLKHTVRSVTQHYDGWLAESGVRITQFTLLVACSLQGPVTVSELAERIGMDRTTLTRNLKPLERDGLLEILTHESDARVRVVQITGEGETTIARAYPLWQMAQEEVTQGLDDEGYENLLQYLERLQTSAH
ncbi:MAG: MarR family winged helix-turn-helix transcriptional regulator [Rubrobacteraceae bacterium]